MKQQGSIVLVAVMAATMVSCTKKAAEKGEGEVKQLLSVTTVVAALTVTVLAGDLTSTWHGDSSLSGATTNPVPDAPVRLWRFPAEGYVENTPVFGDGKVFFVNSKSKIFALNMLKGTQVWSKALADTNIVAGVPPRSISVSAPIAFGFGVVAVVSSDSDVFALDAKTGNVLWQRSVPYERGTSGDANVRSTPNFVSLTDGKKMMVVLWRRAGGGNSIESFLTAFDVSNGDRVWETSDPFPQVDGHLSARGSLLAFGSCGQAIHLISASNGSEIGSIELGRDAQVAGGVAMAGNRVYSGSRCGSMYCVSASAKKVEWEFPTDGGELFSTPAASLGFAVIATRRGAIVAVDSTTGKEKWTFDPGGYDAESPTIAGNRVVATAGGKIYVLDINDGKKELWKTAVGDRATAPAVSEGMIVVGVDDNVVAFGQPGANTGEKK